LDYRNDTISAEAARALSKLGESRGEEALKLFLRDNSVDKRKAAVGALARDRNEIDRRLLTNWLEGLYSWIDPAAPITSERVAECARVLNLTEEEIRERYRALASDFQLTLAFDEEPDKTEAPISES
jgi:HEAT repeat protein